MEVEWWRECNGNLLLSAGTEGGVWSIGLLGLDRTPKMKPGIGNWRVAPKLTLEQSVWNGTRWSICSGCMKGEWGWAVLRPQQPRQGPHSQATDEASSTPKRDTQAARDKAIHTPLGESKEDCKSQEWWAKQGSGGQKTLSSAPEENSAWQNTRHTKWSFKNMSLVTYKRPYQKPNSRWEKNHLAFWNCSSSFFLMTNMKSMSIMGRMENT